MPLQRLSPTQQSMIHILRDGQPHSVKELISLCGNYNTMKVHLSIMRRKLEAVTTKENRLLIITVFSETDTLYQLVWSQPFDKGHLDRVNRMFDPVPQD